MAKTFIAKAIKPSRKGVFKAKAKRAGKSTKAFAQEKKGAPGALGKEARLAITLMKMNKGGKSKTPAKRYTILD